MSEDRIIALTSTAKIQIKNNIAGMAYMNLDEISKIAKELKERKLTNKQAERKALFEKVAIQLIPCLVPNEKEWIKNKDLIQKARGLTEAILSAADKLGKEVGHE